MNKLIVDIDNTNTIHGSSANYADKIPNLDLIEKLREYRAKGYEIVLFSARNMKTYIGDIGKITKNTLPILIKWLEDNKVEYDSLIMGKPWCGEKGFYVDDKAIRPDEFINLSENEILKITGCI